MLYRTIFHLAGNINIIQMAYYYSKLNNLINSHVIRYVYFKGD